MARQIPNKIKERLDQLKKTIEKYRYEYHVLDKETISSAALDSLKHELVLIETEYPELITPDSPTQRVAGKPLDEFKKVAHKVAQWSINDAFSFEEVENFDKRVRRFLEQAGVNNPSPTYTCEHKIDGLHIVLEYEKGLFKTAATRGDGIVGDDVTENIKTIESVPLKLEKPVDIIVEGEVWMAKSTLKRLNEAQKKVKGELFANPRNLAAGSIHQLDPKITASRHLDTFIYDIARFESTPKTQHEELEFLKSLGFKVNGNFRHCRNLGEVSSYWEEWKEKMPKQDYFADGIVIKMDERNYQEILGYTGKGPRFVVAWKFPAEQVTTVVEDITLQVGRTGVITPVATLRPVPIAGSVVSRATLHNEDEIKRLDVRIGDTVILQKAGDVIPDIVSVVKELRPVDSKQYVFPDKVPACGGDGRIERVPGQVAYRCVNKNSFAQHKRKLYHFTSKKAFDIDGLGPRIIDLLLENNLISTFYDIFTLKKGDLLNLPRFAEKSADNLLEAIEKAKKIPLPKFLVSLSIPQVGEETAIDLADHFGNLAAVRKASFEELDRLSGIGPVVGKSLSEWFADKENKKIVDRLLLHVTVLKHQKKDVSSLPLAGKIFVVTGTLKSLSREGAKEKIRELGGSVSESVSNKTNFVLAGENPGSKLDKAKSLKVEVINEEEFLKMLG